MVSLAFHSSSHNRSAGRRPGSVFGLMLAAYEAVVREWHIRRSIRQIEAMDRRMLLDLGITPGRIEDAVRHGR